MQTDEMPLAKKGFIDTTKQVKNLAVCLVFGHAKTLCAGGTAGIVGNIKLEMDDSLLLCCITTGQNHFSFSGSDAA